MRAKVQQWARHIKTQQWSWPDTYSLGNMNHLSQLLSEALPGMQKPSESYGYHFLFNTQTNSRLGSDGYDNYQAPVDSQGNQLFSRRMWVNGSLTYFSTPPKPMEYVDCIENVSSVKNLGANVFVNVARDFFRSDQLIMSESRTLLYTNEAFKVPEVSEASKERKHSYLHYRHDRFTLQQLMRFCSLTYNLHKIHYDTAYCKDEGLAGVIISGPFMVSVLLQYFNSQFPDLAIKTFKYKNREPCYVNEEVLLGIEERDAGYVLRITKNERVVCEGHVQVEPK